MLHHRTEDVVARPTAAAPDIDVDGRARDLELHQQRCGPLAARLPVGLHGTGHGRAELDPDRPADDLGHGGVDGRAELAFEPGDVERIGDHHAYDAGAGVVRQPTRAAQIRVEVRLARVELQAGQDALPDEMCVGSLRVGPWGGNRRGGRANHGQGTDSRD